MNIAEQKQNMLDWCWYIYIGIGTFHRSFYYGCDLYPCKDKCEI